MPERLDFPVGDKVNGQIVQIGQALNPVQIRGAGLPVPMMDFLWLASYNGWIYTSGDADQNDTVTGQTSFADTTPTFLLDVPAGTNVIPLFANLVQTGTVAGGDIELLIEIDKVKRYASGGTSEKIFNTRNKVSRCALYSGATAVTGYGMTLNRYDLGPDVSAAEGAVQGPFWKPDAPYILRGSASLLVYSSAGTTGPTWHWGFGWIEMSDAEMDRMFGPYFAE